MLTEIFEILFFIKKEKRKSLENIKTAILFVVIKLGGIVLGSNWSLKPIFAITMLIWLLGSPASGQQNRVTSEMNNQHPSWEFESQRIKEEIEEIKEQQNDLTEKNKELQRELEEYKPFKFWAWILGGLGVGSILGLLLLSYKVIPAKINTQIDAVITKIFTDRREDFLGLLKEYDFEKTIKQKFQIVLLSHRNGTDNYHYRMLSKNGFNVKAFTNLDQLQDVSFGQNDIIVINDEGGHWGSEQIDGFINACSNYCFYIGGKRIITTGKGVQDKFAAANIRTQFIGNLMNMLKYA